MEGVFSGGPGCTSDQWIISMLSGAGKREAWQQQAE
jgi:hypothetical protein